tara:strand:- start:1361 stop:3058 length:1698 start_codon:yes stop_codon:yes gene_type:complete
MKKIVLAIIALAIVSLTSFAQSPEGFKYQAVVRDAGNAILTNQSVGMRLAIKQGSATGTAVYTETFSSTTNAFGLVNLEIGSGSSTDVFADINWANGPYFIETAADITGGTNYTVMGTSQLMSVPYALHAKIADSALVDLVDDADNDPSNEIQVISLSNDTLFLSNGGFAKLPGGFNGDFNSLTNLPANLDIDSTNDFDGNYSSLVGAPTLISSFTNDAGYLTSFTELDGDSTNEIQVLSISNDTLFLSNSGFVVLPASGGAGGNWTLTGNNISKANAGNVGIGTTNPKSLLMVVEDSLANIELASVAFNKVKSGSLIFNENSTYNGFCGFQLNHDGAANALSLISGCSSPDTIFRASRNGYLNVKKLAVGGSILQNPFSDFSVTGASEFTGNMTITGNLTVTGSIAKGSGTFKIDHPLDPANKYLVHSFVESPEMMNIYSGNIVTGTDGYATVELPSYFEAANKDFRYQLTVIGTFANAIVKEKISNNTFVIQTNEPNVEVSWAVTGVRADKFANKNRVQPEEDKEIKGSYVHPELYNMPSSDSVIKRKEQLMNKPTQNRDADQ